MENPGNYPGGSAPPHSASNKKLQQTQAQVDEVVGIMRSNVAKVLERDEKLSELNHRADNLQVGASQFEQQASRLKRKYWWKNLKMMIIIGVICAALLIIIFVSIFTSSGEGSSTTSNDKPATIAPTQPPVPQPSN